MPRTKKRVAIIRQPMRQQDGVKLQLSDITGVTPPGNGGTGTGTAFTPGSIVFAGASGIYAQDNANMFWNNSQKRLGFGTLNPYTRFHVSVDSPKATVATTRGMVISTSDVTNPFALDFRLVGAAAIANRLVYIQTTDLDLVDGGNIAFQPGGGSLGIGTTAFPSTGSAGLVFGDGTALATMGLNTAGLYANDVGGTVNMFAINEAGEVTRLSWPAPQTYLETNVTVDRAFDANATSIDELADVLGTLIADLRARGVVL